MTITREEVAALIQELLEASQKYNQDGEESSLSDETFDAKQKLLEEEAENYPDLFLPGSPAWELLEHTPGLGSKPPGATPIVVHKTPMLSLDKAKTPEALESYLRKTRKAGAQDFKCQVKLDGFALAAVYQQGHLTQLATRGTGEVGENTTYLTHDPKVTVLGLPQEIASLEPLEVRGELFFSAKQFQTVDKARQALENTPFKNSRNAVVGLMKKAKLGVNYPVEFTFATYGALQGEDPLDLESLPQGFTTVDALTQEQAPGIKLTSFKNDAEVLASIKALGVSRKTWTIPTDGVVIKPTNEAELLKTMGVTSHHPVSQIAYKYPGATATTTVKAITLTVGKTGKLTPCALIEPVTVNGTTISNVTMSNFNWMYSKGVKIGSTVEVHRANDVIPEIKTVLTSPPQATFLEVPQACPRCGSTLVTKDDPKVTWPPKTLRCDNETCPSRNYFALKTIISKNYLDIDGLSEGALESLYDEGIIQDWADLYKLTQDFLQDRPMGTSSKTGSPIKVGSKRAKNILAHLEASKTLSPYRLLMSLTIRNLGPATAKTLLKTFHNVKDLQGASQEAIAQEVGPIIGGLVYQGLQEKAPLIKRLEEAGVVFTPLDQTTPRTPGTTTSSKVQGLAVALSGEVPPPFPNRTSFVEWLETSGGTFHSSPKATTTHFIGDPTSPSAKTKKALELKTRGQALTFMSPEEFSLAYYPQELPSA